MGGKFFTAIVMTLVALGVLVYAGTNANSRSVVTVSDLTKMNQPLNSLRLGARVTSDEIVYTTDPKFILSFKVTDPATKSGVVPVVYNGIMPDTLKEGRDVILEGDYDGKQFIAKTLLTQCPSKYKAPVPEQ